MQVGKGVNRLMMRLCNASRKGCEQAYDEAFVTQVGKGVNRLMMRLCNASRKRCEQAYDEAFATIKGSLIPSSSLRTLALEEFIVNRLYQLRRRNTEALVLHSIAYEVHDDVLRASLDYG